MECGAESGQPESEKSIHVDLVMKGDIVKVKSGEQVWIGLHILDLSS